MSAGSERCEAISRSTSGIQRGAGAKWVAMPKLECGHVPTHVATHLAAVRFGTNTVRVFFSSATLLAQFWRSAVTPDKLVEIFGVDSIRTNLPAARLSDPG
jgi:hypothetical protein